MAPFRNRDRSNRSGRGQVEHNVLEGLPINQYREVEINIGPSSTETKQVDKDAWPELPMPRDALQLPEHSQQLLRAARAGKVHKPPAPPEEDVENRDEDDDHKEVPQGFTVKKWVKVARHLEEPEPEYLAKRRKGLPSQYTAGQVVIQPAPMRETKVKKVDAEGNVVVYKALVPEGQAVEGELQATDAVIEAAPVVVAPGTVVEGVGVVNAEGVVVAKDILQQTPPRRRPPHIKKKRRSGPGRGKKKVIFAEGTEQGAKVPDAGTALLPVPNLKQEGSVEPSEGGDTPMPDAADDDEGSGEEGSDDDDRDDEIHSPPHVETPHVEPQHVEIPPVAAPTEPLNEPIVPSPPKAQPEDTVMTDAAPTAESLTHVTSPVVPSVTPTEAKLSPAPETGVEVKSEAETWTKSEHDQPNSSDKPPSPVSNSQQDDSTPQVPPTASIETLARESPPQPAPVEVSVPVAEPSIVEPAPDAPPSELPAPKVESASPSAPAETKVGPEAVEAPLEIREPTPSKPQEQATADISEGTVADPPPEVPVEAESSTEISGEEPADTPFKAPVDAIINTPVEAPDTAPAPVPIEPLKEAETAEDSEPDLLGSLESHLEKERETMATQNP